MLQLKNKISEKSAKLRVGNMQNETIMINNSSIWKPIDRKIYH